MTPETARATAQRFALTVLDTVTEAMAEGQASPDNVLKALESQTDAFAAEVAEGVQTPTEATAALVLKTDATQRMMWGWASVTTRGGQEVTDLQGDIIPTDVMQKAAHDFMGQRVGKTMHRGRKTSVVVDSIVFTTELQKALGIDLGCEGWFVGVKVYDDDTWERVQRGELRAFSIGGTGVRAEVTA